MTHQNPRPGAAGQGKDMLKRYRILIGRLIRFCMVFCIFCIYYKAIHAI